jgi:hemoglobin-like flavoprotein
MTKDLSERAQAIVAETLPLMKRHRAPLEQALERYMARQGPYHPSAERTKATTAALADMLFGQAGRLVGDGASANIVEAARRHRTLALGGEHYSSFGDALKPIMIDVLGTNATPSVIAAWVDAYWAIVRMSFRQETRLAA